MDLFRKNFPSGIITLNHVNYACFVFDIRSCNLCNFSVADLSNIFLDEHKRVILISFQIQYSTAKKEKKN